MTSRQRVLVIDDDVMFGRVVARMLAPEHDVVTLTSGREALTRIATGERFALILCDVMMPQVTGIDVYKRIGVVAPELVDRIVFVSGGGFTAEAHAFLMQPHLHQIEKPFALVTFRQTVAKHLQRLASQR